MSTWRTKSLPKDWPQTRRRILRRDQGICHVCSGPGATQVDHVLSAAFGGSDEDHNLGAIHTLCHQKKTSREAHAARPLRKRQPEEHPGMMGI